ncbi:MAG TPA: TMEM175 family protein [Chryseolinea sp.]|nr:TMEM175 family protein [Chryseolinea sp.]HPM28845.1 TMEM175 family protein [Chryseolinea sp.]
MTLTESKFPTDRVLYFSDAIFAIAITLLVLEIKLPSNEDVKSLGIGGVLMSRIPNLIGFFISFFVTALFWRAHLQISKYIKQMSNGLLWINLWLLLFVVLMPFSTALYSNYALSNEAFDFYCANVSAIGIFMFLYIRKIIQQENLTETFGKTQSRWIMARALIVPIFFVLSIVLTFVSITLSRYAFLLIFVLHAFGEWYLKKRQNSEENRAQVAKTDQE